MIGRRLWVGRIRLFLITASIDSACLVASDPQFEVYPHSDLKILSRLISEGASSEASMSLVERVLRREANTGALVLVPAASSRKGLESFGMSHLAASTPMEYIRNQRRELSKGTVVSAAR